MLTSDEFEALARETVLPVLAAAGLKEVAWQVAWQVQRGRFESDLVWAEVVYNPPAGQFWLNFDRLDVADAQAKFDLSDAIALVDRRAAALHARYFARTAREARASLERLAGDIERYCGSVLLGDPGAFVAMAAVREDQRVKRAEWEHRAANMGLDDAVAHREWARVAAIWSMATHELNGAARRRYDIARQNARTWHFRTAQQSGAPEFSEALDLEYHGQGPWAGEDPVREAAERAVGDAMDAHDWPRVAGIYESAPYELDYLELARREIARERLGEPGAGISPPKAPRALTERLPWQHADTVQSPQAARPTHIALAHDDSETVVAQLVSEWIAATSAGAPTTGRHSKALVALGSWLPDVLRRARPGRAGRQFLDITVTSLAARGPLDATAVGHCKPMFEPAPSPFALDLRLSAAECVGELQVCVGSPEVGSLDLDLTVEFVPRGEGEFWKPDENLIASRQGFAVRSQPPHTVVYLESGRELPMVVELLMTDQMALATRLSELNGWAGFEDAPELPQAERIRIARNVQRALAWNDVTLVVT
jgi:hypothetical protein